MPPERRRRLLGVGSFLGLAQRRAGHDGDRQAPAVNPANGAQETTYLLQAAPGPRAWLVGHVEVMDDAEALARLADPAFDPWQTALVAPEGGVETLYTASLQPLATIAQPTYRQLAPGHVVVEVAADAPALLALSEMWYPGWQATVDGAPAPLLRAYNTLMAVPVPAGAHTVELRFDPAVRQDRAGRVGPGPGPGGRGTRGMGLLEAGVRAWLVALLLVIAAFLPRAVGLAQFATWDELFWTHATLRFWRAVDTQRWPRTYIIGQPGVVSMCR
ncbi:MAG: YfhO family protein [Anaerolineae bacterium]